jgi:hypothetical protein
MQRGGQDVLKDIIQSAIDELNKRFYSDPLVFFNESDLQSELFTILNNNKELSRNERIDEIRVWGTDSPDKARDVFTRKVHSELLLPDGRIDIAVLDLSHIILSVNSKGKFGYIQLLNGEHYFIEIKASRTNRSQFSSKNGWAEIIKKDIKKLRRYDFDSYLLCYDFNDLLTPNEIADLKREVGKRTTLVYAKDRYEDRYLE